jgi:hypothetical protein
MTMSEAVCAKCGEHNPGGTEFCGACGTFLAWQAAPAEEPPKVLTPVPGPAVQQPTDERVLHRSAPVRTELQPPNPGDLICGQCGIGNVPTRRFCRHCGHSLAEAAVVRPRWWQRLIPKRRKKRRHAGDRPKARGGRPWRAVSRWITRMLLAVLAVAGLLYAAVPPFRTAANHQALAAKNWVTHIFDTKYTPIRATKVTANVSIPSHDAGLAADNAKNTFWAAPTNTGIEPALVFTFDHPVDIRQAIIRGGNAADFEGTHRPAKLHLVYSTGKTYDVTLADTPDAQTVDISQSAGATSVEIHIVALHRSLKGTDVAISEIELFEKAS